MIVKNEAPVIRRCLDSVRPIIDYWVIVDTGSSDGTQEIIREYFRDLPGELHERPWQDFAHNRSEALALARPHGDYSLIIDADDALEIPAGYQLPELTADAYVVDIQDVALTYQRTQIVRNTLPWRYVGVLHEFIAAEGSNSSGNIPIVMRRNHDGARRRDSKTYEKDAGVLERALEIETDPFLRARYTFYLAQSYRDCGQKQKALDKYLARAELGSSQDEVFVSLLNAARLMEQLEHSEGDIIDTYMRASNAVSTRVEALHGASRFCRLKNRFEEGYQIANRGTKIEARNGGLFVEPWIYQYGLLDELAVNAYWSGHYPEAIQACETLLYSGNLPAEHRGRIIANANFARQKLGFEAKTLPGWTEEQRPFSRNRPKIAIYATARDDANSVDAWRESAADADYWVVADAGRTGDAAERLAAAGALVHRIAISPWRPDDARNALLALLPTEADICIALDLDERLLPGWRTQLETAWKPGTTRLFYNFANGLQDDGTPVELFREGKIHSRMGYRWKRVVHEDLQRTEPTEERVDVDATLMGRRQGVAEQHGRHLPLLERAHREDPQDAQLCFWLARELFLLGDHDRSAEKLIRYLSISGTGEADERAEAMRCLARLQPERNLEWLQKSVIEAPHRREPWLELAEHYHSKSDWMNLFWACANGLEKTRRIGSRLDNPDAWGFRLHDLMAVACSHLGLIPQAIKHGTIALTFLPEDKRLANNLAYYDSQRAKQRSSGDTAQQSKEADSDQEKSREAEKWRSVTPKRATGRRLESQRENMRFPPGHLSALRAARS